MQTKPKPVAASRKLAIETTDHLTREVRALFLLTKVEKKMLRMELYKRYADARLCGEEDKNLTAGVFLALAVTLSRDLDLPILSMAEIDKLSLGS